MGEEYLRIAALPVVQPIGQFYVGVISHTDLIQISFADMRRIERELDRYVGIQRKLLPQRVEEIGAFVNTIDATFPTSIVLSVPGSCAQYLEETKELVLTEGLDEETGKPIPHYELAKILDGQHRIEGLKNLASGVAFQLAVSIFVEADIADQAYVFATVNLSQTKVNRSLVYDLLDYTKARSPQRSCHDIAVALDKFGSSPLHNMIKRLGSATPGRSGETLTQATVVDSLLPFISTDPLGDREKLARGKKVATDDTEYQKTPFRHIWVAKRDADIARVLMEYFSAVAERWPQSWKGRERGNILPRTNGFRAFMRFLKNAYLHELPRPSENGVLTRDRFREIISAADVRDGEFTTEVFPPGTSGEKLLYDRLRESTKI
jgi:DGQHR domain-containing protein